MRDASRPRPHTAPPNVPAELPTDRDELRSLVRDLAAYAVECFAESYPHGITRFVPPSATKLDEIVDRVVSQQLAEQNSEVPRA